MKAKLFVFGIVFLTVVNLAAMATFSYHHFCSRCRNDLCAASTLEPDAILKKELQLSDAQLEQMRQIRDKHKRQMEPIVRHLAMKRSQLTQAIMSEPIDTKKIDIICSQIDSLQADMQRQVIKHLLIQKAVLTAEQQQIFATMMIKCCSTNMSITQNCVMNQP